MEREMKRSSRTALITGAGGQDGSYLAEHLLRSGYSVLGLVRHSASASWPLLEHLRGSIELISDSLLHQHTLEQVLRRHRPTEVYNLAAYHPASSQAIDDPVSTAEVNGLTVTRWLEAIRIVDPGIRFCQASTSQLFGQPRESPQNECSELRPTNPYSIAKLYAHWTTVSYRERHGLFACSAILFNHESPRRAERFVTRKITRAVGRIRAGLQSGLTLENLDTQRDWGFAPDYARGMWLMLQAPVADDYVLATGELHSVREFCEIAFERAGLDYRRFVTESAATRGTSIEIPTVGDASKARRELGWQPTVTFRQLVTMMTDADIALAEREALRQTSALPALGCMPGCI